MSEHKESALKKWLDNLQQESWQLELLVSGFVIFLLLGFGETFTAIDLELSHLRLAGFKYALLGIPLVIIKAAWLILLINLLLHVFLRGLWISTIGLRYVSQEIDLEALNFKPRFNNFLEKRLGSFDNYIETLEKLCSIIFAFTFLLVFMVFSLGLYLTILIGSLAGLQSGLGMDNAEFRSINQVINLTFTLFGLLYTIDFISLGWFKKRKWVAFWYYPIYRLMGFMTGARLYRPLYYNLIDNKFGRKLSFFLVPYIVVLMIISSVKIITDAYYPINIPAEYPSMAYYDNEQLSTVYSSRASIPDKYIQNGFLEIFIPYHPSNDDRAIQEQCPDLSVAQHTGLKLEGIVTLGGIENSEANRDSLLLCLSSIHRIYVNDSLFAQPDVYFYKHPQRQDEGLKMVIDINYLERGKQVLKIESFQTKHIIGHRYGESEWKIKSHIPFWIID